MFALGAPQGAFVASPYAQGTLMVVRLVEYLNMSAHIVVGFPLNVTVVKPVHDANASLPIVVTPAGIVISVILLAISKSFCINGYKRRRKRSNGQFIAFIKCMILLYY